MAYHWGAGSGLAPPDRVGTSPLPIQPRGTSAYACLKQSCNPPTLPFQVDLEDTRQVRQCEVLDRVPNKGVVVSGEAAVSAADIGLICLGLQVVLTSVVTARLGSRPVPTELSSKMGPARLGMREG